MTHQLVIRGGTVIDGTGAAARAGDIAVDAGRITTVGGWESAPDGVEPDATIGTAPGEWAVARRV